MTTRRQFLQTCLALAAAPALVRASSLMRVYPADLRWTIEVRIDLPIIQVDDAFTVEQRYNNGLFATYRYFVTGLSVDGVRDIEGMRKLRKLYANGVSIQIPTITSPTIQINELDLTNFGNCIPNFSVDVDVVRR